MKEQNDLILPDNVRYSEDHEWAKLEGDKVVIGVSDFAQDQMGDITFVETPEIGTVIQGGENFGTLESTKAVSELLAPMSGEVIAVNEALNDNPGLVNQDPYGQGWIIEIRPSDLSEMDKLMSVEAYTQMLKGA